MPHKLEGVHRLGVGYVLARTIGGDIVHVVGATTWPRRRRYIRAFCTDIRVATCDINAPSMAGVSRFDRVNQSDHDTGQRCQPVEDA